MVYLPWVTMQNYLCRFRHPVRFLTYQVSFTIAAFLLDDRAQEKVAVAINGKRNRTERVDGPPEVVEPTITETSSNWKAVRKKLGELALRVIFC